MERIANLFASLPLSAALQARLADPEQLRNHRFYLDLPQGLAVIFTGISEESLSELLVSSYLYFRTLLFLDDLLDGETRAASEEEVEEIFLYFSLYERSIRGLAGLFPGQHPFWGHLEQCKKEYALANQREKRATAQVRTWTQQEYEALAAGKSAVCGAMVYALEGLGETQAVTTGAMLQSLRVFHLAVQYEDDVLDFAKDVAQGQYTYVYYLLRERLLLEQVDIASLPSHLLQAMLYTTGTATTLLEQAALL
ncbi:MAG: hypothetical protein EOO60_14285 [Hymenobacter sp.]|nr:MAG: hypothetical protein EOO60_14285 [Hymenobacter sp.]